MEVSQRPRTLAASPQARSLARLPASVQPALPGARLAVLALAYLLPGLIGHDLWKSDDAIGFGVAYSMLDTHHWLTPTLAGEPYYRDGPLYYWGAALCARAFSFILPLHDGARVATLLSIGLALYFTRLAARELYGKRAGDLSFLALLGCGGLVIQARVAAPETLALAAVAATYYGVAIAWQKPLKAAIFLGGGLACALLSKGLVATLPPLVAILLILPLARSNRKLGFVRAGATGIFFALLLAAPWLIAVWQQDPQYLDNWWQAQIANISTTPSLSRSLDYVKTLAWAAWPAWPLALWAMWENRRQLGNIGVAVPFAASIVSIALLFFNPWQREIDALTLLVPLSIPAGAVALRLRRGAANALGWFSVMTFSLVVLTVWVMWLATATGVPAKLAAAATRLEPGYQHDYSWISAVVALAYTVGWFTFIFRSEITPQRCVAFWTAGVTGSVGVIVALALGWIDYGKSYMGVASAVRAHLPRDTRCVASEGLGDVQRAVFHYHGGFVTRPESAFGEASSDTGSASCNVLLVQSYAGDTESVNRSEWRKIWEGSRPRDRERYRLYTRRHPATTPVR